MNARLTRVSYGTVSVTETITSAHRLLCGVHAMNGRVRQQRVLTKRQTSINTPAFIMPPR
ncbi:hypothetical protein J6590_058538 [Homalodisca vitripennis]|nr:hypothetical protein J6590_058538 [Homalodisca vitripennis]